MLCTPTRRLFLAGVAASTLARASAEARPVVVGSKLDLEGGLLGHMMLLALAEAKIATENRLRIGPTSILRAALLSGAIDLCPEYTGNAAFFFHEDGDPVWKDAAAGYARAALDNRLQQLGVRRVSAGSAIAQAALGCTSRLAAGFLAGTMGEMFGAMVEYGAVNELFASYARD